MLSETCHKVVSLDLGTALKQNITLFLKICIIPDIDLMVNNEVSFLKIPRCY